MEKKGFNFNKLIGFNVFTITLVLIVFLGGVGLTYAYYAFSYEEESVIVGNVVNVDIDLEVELVVGSNDAMVPMNNDALSNAINGVGSPNGACVDQYNNLSCQVYKITVINKGSRVKHLKGTIELYAKEGTENVYNNLKWRELTNPTTVKSDAVVNGMEKSVLVSGLTMESKQTKVWYIAVWISETNSDQRETDKGLFGGTVTFETEGVATVTLDPNGGTVDVTEKEAYIGSTYGDLPTPTRTGYTFDGWYTEASEGTKVTNDSIVSGSSNQTLYARWEGYTYYVKYNPNGGSGTMSNSSHTYGTAANLTANAFTKTGYSFNGWNTKADGTGTSYANKASVDNLTSTNEGIFNLYAQWNPKEYKVTFDANGGSVSTTSKTVTYGSTYGTLPTPTKSGNTFNGWYTKKSEGTQVKASSKVSITSNQTLYAHWIYKIFPDASPSSSDFKVVKESKRTVNVTSSQITSTTTYTSDCIGRIFTSSKIDVTNYKTLSVTYSVKNFGDWSVGSQWGCIRFGLTSSQYSDTDGFAFDHETGQLLTLGTTVTETMNISSITGQWYFSFYFGSGNNVVITDISMY